MLNQGLVVRYDKETPFIDPNIHRGHGFWKARFQIVKFGMRIQNGPELALHLRAVVNIQPGATVNAGIVGSASVIDTKRDASDGLSQLAGMVIQIGNETLSENARPFAVIPA